MSTYPREFGDEVVTLGDVGRSDHLGHQHLIAQAGRVQSEDDVLLDAAVEERRLLSHQAQAVPQVRNVDLLYLHVVYGLQTFRTLFCIGHLTIIINHPNFIWTMLKSEEIVSLVDLGWTLIS